MPLTNVAYFFEEELPHKTLTIPRLLGTSTGWYRTKRPMQLNHILIYYAPSLSSNNSRFIHQCSLLWLQQRHLVGKRELTWREMCLKLAVSISVHTCRPGVLNIFSLRAAICDLTHSLSLQSLFYFQQQCCQKYFHHFFVLLL
jgi:hypothetical protein